MCTKAVLNSSLSRVQSIHPNTRQYFTTIHHTRFNRISSNPVQRVSMCSDHSDGLTLILCRGSSSDNQPTQDEGIQVDIAVGGMMCDGCTSRIEEELGKKDSVVAVHANLDSGMVTVTLSADNFGDAVQTMESLVHDIQEMGFEASPSL